MTWHTLGVFFNLAEPTSAIQIIHFGPIFESPLACMKKNKKQKQMLAHNEIDTHILCKVIMLLPTFYHFMYSFVHQTYRLIDTFILHYYLTILVICFLSFCLSSLLTSEHVNIFLMAIWHRSCP